MQYLFTNTFPLDRKIKLSVAGVPENGRKKIVFFSQKSQFPQAGIRLFFKKSISLAEKNLQIKEYCFK